MRYSSAPLLIWSLSLGCSADPQSMPFGQGGTPTPGGGATTGGGNSTPGSGGTVATGGTVLTTSGGAISQGGSASGGVSNGGQSLLGGSSTLGGSAAGGSASKGGAAGAVGTVSGGSGGAGGQSGTKFSFFVTSLGAMRELSKSQDGFGGDLRFGEATGLAGADKICKTIAEKALPGAGQKEWRAFLSTAGGGTGGGTPVNAIDRIGSGPWYDRLGRVVAMTKADLLFDRPKGADPAIIDDLPNENGIPNHIDGAPGCTGNNCPDNHDTLTGTGPKGTLYAGGGKGGGTVTPLDYTCNDWTNKEPTGKPWCGHSWPRVGSGVNWMSALAEGGCAPGVNLAEKGGPEKGVFTVGTGGGYGGIYCFALTP